MTREALLACWPYLAGIASCVVGLRLLLAVSGARPQPARLWRLHRDETGAVQSLSFVLTLPLFVMVILFIVQLSQITIGRLVVEYAAFAAARSAVVWIPANTGDGWETENRINLLDPPPPSPILIEDELGTVYERYRVVPGGPKFERVRLAAATALMSICPSRDVGANPQPASSLHNAYLAMSPAAARNGRVPVRLRNKLAYALEATEVDIEVRHRVDLPDLVEDSNRIGWQDQIYATVTHNFALLPGPGRFLARHQPRVDPNGGIVEADRVAARIWRRRGVAVYTLTATARLNNEGEVPAFSYIQPPQPQVARDARSLR